MNVHRRAVLGLAIGTVVAFAAVVSLSVSMLLTQDPVACSCSRAAAAVSSASHGRWIGAAVLALTLGVLVAVAVSTVRATRRAERSVRYSRLGRVRIAGTTVQLVNGSAPRAFCTGALRPGIVVTSGFLRLSESEQRAVLAHELAHRSARDPLAFAIVDSLAAVLPFLAPVAQEVRRQAEFAADDAARSAVGDPAFAQALATGIAAAEFGASFSPTEARVRRFLGRPYAAPRAPLVAAATILAVSVGILVLGSVGTRNAAAQEVRWCASQPVLCHDSEQRSLRSTDTTIQCRSTSAGTVCGVR